MRVSYISERSTNWTPQSTDRLSTLTSTKIFLDENDDEDSRDDKRGFFCSPCIKGCIVGSMICAVALAVFLTLKLTARSSSTTTTTTTSSTTTTTTSGSCSHLRWNQTAVTLPGISDNRFQYPRCLYIDLNDALYICDHTDRSVEAWFKGTINGTKVTDGHGYHADYMTFDKNGFFYITEHIYRTVRRYSPNSVNSTLVAGGGTPSSALNSFANPLGIDVDDNFNLYIADPGNKRVMKWTPNATNGTIVINTNSSNITTSISALRLAKGSSDRVYLSDGSYNRVYLWSFDSVYPDMILNQVRNSTVLSTPKDLIFDPYENLYVAENSAKGRVIRYCPNSTIGEIVIEGSGTSSTAKVGIAFDSNLNLYALLGNGTVWKYELL